MEENHTFDNYFGAFPGATGSPSRRPRNPAPHDIGHSGPRALAAIDGGKMDGFDPLGKVQYQRSDIPVDWDYATHFGLGDNFFTSAASSSTPNHLSMIASQTAGEAETIANVTGCASPPNDVVLQRDTLGNESFGLPCYDVPTIPDELTHAGLSYRFYGTMPHWDASRWVTSLAGGAGGAGDLDHQRRREQPAAERELRDAQQRPDVRPRPAADPAGPELRVLDRQQRDAERRHGHRRPSSSPGTTSAATTTTCHPRSSTGSVSDRACRCW